MKLQENTVFANRYELAKLLGRGGFSEVWLAKDQLTHLNVAIKVYAPGQGMEEDGMREFCGELAGVYDINHSNLLKPQHVDAWEGMPYLIMAYCPNGSCERLIGKVTEEQMWKMIHDVAAGLAYLHENDIVHQDIKPANILIAENGRYQITDFGVSSRARSTLRKSVVSSTGGGTTAYMGPERFSKQPAPTKASDIWSFGAMCFEMVEGYVPFGENGGVSQKIGADIPVISADVSDALKYAITMMLQKETWDRPTAATLVEWSAAPQCIKVDGSAITSGDNNPQETAVSGRPTARRNVAPVSETDLHETVQKPMPDIPQEEAPQEAKGNRKMWILVGVLAAVICVLCILLLGGKKDNPEMPVEDSFEIAQVGDTVREIAQADTVEENVMKPSDMANSKPEAARQVEQPKSEDKPEEQPKQAVNRRENTETFTVNGVTFKMVKVAGGTFQMGSSYNVTLSDYYIGETEVIQALWKAVMGSNPSYFKGDNLPVEQVSWNDCQEFIKKLNQLTGRTFTLPTEAQWEFAARGGNKSRGYTHSGSNSIDDVAWYVGNCSNKTHQVGTKQANELGLYDMNGNVWEWCADRYGSPLSPSHDPSGSCRVLCGGSWNDAMQNDRSNYRRFESTPNGCSKDNGLRLALPF